MTRDFYEKLAKVRHQIHAQPEISAMALQTMKNCGKPYIIYYGTEKFMANKTTIMNAEPYADLRVREAMVWECHSL